MKAKKQAFFRLSLSVNNISLKLNDNIIIKA